MRIRVQQRKATLLTSAWQRLPASIRRRIRRRVAAHLFSDRNSEELFWETFAAAGDADQTPVPIRLRSLNDNELLIRPGTSDSIVLLETFIGGFHRPPKRSTATPPRFILDLGCNIGATVVDLATRFRGATVIGVELDPANATLARRNVAPWQDRCEIVQAAVWHEATDVGYETSPGDEYATRVTRGSTVGRPTTRGIPIDMLLDTFRSPEVDYLKVDIEGAEQAVFAEGGRWASQTRCLKVEIHQPYDPRACRTDLLRLGFDVRRDFRRPNTLVAFGRHGEPSAGQAREVGE